MLIIRNSNEYHTSLRETIKKDEDWDGYYFDLRGACEDHAFPDDEAFFASMFGQLIRLRTFKRHGDCHWRLHMKKKGVSSIYLKVRDCDTSISFKFCAPCSDLKGYLDLSVRDTISMVAYDKYYKGASKNAPAQITYPVYDKGIEQFSNQEMLDEMELRNKQANPDWADDLRRMKDAKQVPYKVRKIA
jgi:hypothetical protein